ncbi:MAG: hypothetical protein WAU53_00390, partial [Rhodoplanes sp.]
MKASPRYAAKKRVVDYFHANFHLTTSSHFSTRALIDSIAEKEYTRARVPLDWAMTQMNLGVALKNLGERESGTDKLDEAVAAYREALKEYTRARVPLDWARTTGNQGVALMRLAERQ